eukprot:m.257619 g.257619  ORF g.257619 m.257619 type:complete len:359 (-) comp11032_c0_seq14:3042-4118(-)
MPPMSRHLPATTATTTRTPRVTTGTTLSSTPAHLSAARRKRHRQPRPQCPPAKALPHPHRGRRNVPAPRTPPRQRRARTSPFSPRPNSATKRNFATTNVASLPSRTRSLPVSLGACDLATCPLSCTGLFASSAPRSWATTDALESVAQHPLTGNQLKQIWEGYHTTQQLRIPNLLVIARAEIDTNKDTYRLASLDYAGRFTKGKSAQDDVVHLIEDNTIRRYRPNGDDITRETIGHYVHQNQGQRLKAVPSLIAYADSPGLPKVRMDNDRLRAIAPAREPFPDDDSMRKALLDAWQRRDGRGSRNKRGGGKAPNATTHARASYAQAAASPQVTPNAPTGAPPLATPPPPRPRPLRLPQ